MKRSPVVCIAILALTVGVFGGCGSGRKKVETVAVSGTVKLNGSPLAGATVNFEAAEYAGIATTDSSGHYELEAQAGQNKVYISKLDGADPNWDETMAGGSDTGEGGGAPKQAVPAKYSDPSKTELSFSVPDGGSESADFDLSGK